MKLVIIFILYIILLPSHVRSNSSNKLAPWKMQWRCLVLNIKKGYGWEYVAPYNGPDTHGHVKEFMNYLAKTFKGVVYSGDKDEIEKLEKITISIFETLKEKNPKAEFTNGGDLMKFMIKLDMAEKAARGDRRYFIHNIDTNFIHKAVPDVFMRVLRQKKLDITSEDKIITYYTDFIFWSYGKTIDKFFNSMSEHLMDTVATEGTPLTKIIKNMTNQRSKYYK